MKVIFLQDVSDKAKAGEVKEVARGYAKNFLLPQKLATPVTPTVMKQVELRLRREREQESLDQAKFVELAGLVEGRELYFEARVGTGDRLFGSVTAADIAEELGQIVGSSIDKRKIAIDKPLREVGSHEVIVKLARGLEPRVRVVIEARNS